MSDSRYYPKFSLKRTPRWWRNLHTTRPLRREARRFVHHIVLAQSDDDEAQFSSCNRFRECYW